MIHVEKLKKGNKQISAVLPIVRNELISQRHSLKPLSSAVWAGKVWELIGTCWQYLPILLQLLIKPPVLASLTLTCVEIICLQIRGHVNLLKPPKSSQSTCSELYHFGSL